MNALHTKPTTMHQQHGAVFIVMLVFLIMGSVAILVGSLNSTSLQFRRDEVTTQALSQAKEVLIGYAVSYGDTHPGKANGYLPCPDQGQNNTYDGEAGNSSTCNSKNVSYIGKLPWKTLGLTPPKDSNAECLWYAVSGTYKNTGTTDLLNWDTNGQFQVVAPDGVNLLAGSTADNQAVVVIFAPGNPSGTQNHTSAAGTPSCGGNYTASNYLDNDTDHGIDNATVSPTAFSVTQFIAGVVRSASGNVVVNDNLVFITRNDIFNAIKKRTDFHTFVETTLLTGSSACLATTLPPPVTLTFGLTTPFVTEGPGTSIAPLQTGRVPQSCLPSPTDNWQDNLLYAKCISGTQCITLYTPAALPCRGVVIFAGERTAGQDRVTNLQKNSWNNYLEDAPSANLTAFTTGTTTFSGSTTYSPASPSTDVFACIP